VGGGELVFAGMEDFPELEFAERFLAKTRSDLVKEHGEEVARDILRTPERQADIRRSFQLQRERAIKRFQVPEEVRKELADAERAFNAEKFGDGIAEFYASDFYGAIKKADGISSPESDYLNPQGRYYQWHSFEHNPQSDAAGASGAFNAREPFGDLVEHLIGTVVKAVGVVVDVQFQPLPWQKYPSLPGLEDTMQVLNVDSLGMTKGYETYDGGYDAVGRPTAEKAAAWLRLRRSTSTCE
jgi:hypothetical protein